MIQDVDILLEMYPWQMKTITLIAKIISDLNRVTLHINHLKPSQ